MSLVGSLEDLGLGDILQIVSLSRKSGLLLIHSDEGEGRIVFGDGLVRAAFVKGEAEDLQGLLVQTGFVSEAEFESARTLSETRGKSLDEVIPESTGLTKERLDCLRREHVERAVYRIFAWQGGEFSFEIGEEIDARDREILLPMGVNAQYLTMEATRLGDEGDRLDDDDTPMFSGEEDAGTPVERGPERVEVQSLDDSFAAGSSQAGESVDPPQTAPVREAPRDSVAPTDVHEVVALAAARSEAADVHVEAELSRTETVAEEPAREPAAPPSPHLAECLIALDSKLGSLEWQKATTADLFERIHIFQSVERGVERIRQYLMRGRVPIVLVSATPPSDALDLGGLIRRLKLIAPSMPILFAAEEGLERPVEADAADVIVSRPPANLLDSRRSWSEVEAAASAFRSEIATWLGGFDSLPPIAIPAGTAKPAAANARAGRSGEGLARLQEMSERIRDPRMRGEALSLVLGFAAETFSRVAIFMVRDDTAVGMAQRGFDLADGPDDDGLRGIELPVADVACFRRVLESRSAHRAPLGEADQVLISRLGARVLAEAYVAPIESGGRIVALLYADSASESLSTADTTILEAALHEAGLALERALLERTLAPAAESGDV
jgi:hypothetical protein